MLRYPLNYNILYLLQIFLYLLQIKNIIVN